MSDRTECSAHSPDWRKAVRDIADTCVHCGATICPSENPDRFGCTQTQGHEGLHRNDHIEAVAPWQ